MVVFEVYYGHSFSSIILFHVLRLRRNTFCFSWIFLLQNSLVENVFVESFVEKCFWSKFFLSIIFLVEIIFGSKIVCSKVVCYMLHNVFLRWKLYLVERIFSSKNVLIQFVLSKKFSCRKMFRLNILSWRKKKLFEKFLVW